MHPYAVDSVGQVEYTRERLGLPKVAVELPTLAHVGSPMLNEYLKNRLHNPFMIKTRLPKKPSFAPTGSNARAKLDFRYWYDELIDHKPLNAGIHIASSYQVSQQLYYCLCFREENYRGSKRNILWTGCTTFVDSDGLVYTVIVANATKM